MGSRPDALTEAREFLERARQLIGGRDAKQFDRVQADIGSARVLIHHARGNGVDTVAAHAELRAVEKLLDAWINELATRRP